MSHVRSAPIMVVSAVLMIACGSATPPIETAAEPEPTRVGVALRFEEPTTEPQGRLPETTLALVVIQPEGEVSRELLGTYQGVCTHAPRRMPVLIRATCGWGPESQTVIDVTREGDIIVAFESMDPPAELGRIEVPPNAELDLIRPATLPAGW